MASCELCGQSTDSTKKVKIEGATLDVCDSCAEMGEEVSSSSKKRKKKKTKNSGRNGSSKTLVPDYGEKVKEAREEEQLSLQELSDELNEKQSLLSKIEKEELKPDRSLADKLSQRFNITLYTNSEVSNHDTSQSTDDRKATMEDVADIS